MLRNAVLAKCSAKVRAIVMTAKRKIDKYKQIRISFPVAYKLLELSKLELRRAQ